MQIQKIQNNNYNPQFKSGFITLNTITGTKVSVHPENISSFVQKQIKTICLSAEQTNEFNPFFEHFLKILKVSFNQLGQYMTTGVLVNANEKDLLDAIKKAKIIEDHETVEIGTPLEYLNNVPFANSIYELPKLRKNDLKETYNTTVCVKDKLTLPDGYEVTLSFRSKDWRFGPETFLEESRKIYNQLERGNL